jgi:hypothetical protein
MPPSSTSSSEPPTSRGAWLAAARAVLAVLLCVVAVDVGLRKLAPFELYSDWEHQQIAYKQDKFRSFVDGGGVDVLLAGSSVIMNLDAKRLGRRTHARVFNGGIGSGNPTAMGAILSHMYYPLGKPKVLVYGVSARDLRDSGDAFDQPPFFSNKMRTIRAETWQERLEAAFERVSYLFRIRRQVRDLAHRGEIPRGAEIKTDAYGSRKHRSNGLKHSLNARGQFPPNYAYRSRYNHYRVDLAKGHARQLVSLIEQNEALGIKTVLVNVPLSPAGMTLFDRPEEDYRTYLAALAEVARLTGVELFDAHGDLQLTNADFGDADHMGGRGDQKTEDYLVPVIARHLAK